MNKIEENARQARQGTLDTRQEDINTRDHDLGQKEVKVGEKLVEVDKEKLEAQKFLLKNKGEEKRLKAWEEELKKGGPIPGPPASGIGGEDLFMKQQELLEKFHREFLTTRDLVARQ